MLRVDLIAGARPNFIKIASIIRGINSRQSAGSSLSYRLVHTGQHYDARMSGHFFDQLGIPEPDVNLEAGSGTQAEQTAAIMIRYERLLLGDPSMLTLVVGDVNSTMACSITARKLGLPVAHVEAGIRSHDWTMPEEINRVVTDAIANWFFTTSRSAGENLERAGIAPERIFFVGNTMIDTLLAHQHRFRKPSFWDTHALQPGDYFVVTLHRPANVDSEGSLSRLIEAIAVGTRGLPVVFPMHPRTAKVLGALPSLPANILAVEPQPYFEFNYLVKHARAVITDSGGITEEATIMNVPCLTLRDSTERPETIDVGTNVLIGTDPAGLAPVLDRLFSKQWQVGGVPERWDGRAGTRIAAILEQLLAGCSPQEGL
jgi:UDP-N-acetylglucosamine 2-epimerase (non-hydrolysing)